MSEKTLEKALTQSAPNKVAAVTAKSPAQQGTKKSGGFIVQVGAFTNADSANDLKSQLGEINIKAYTEKIDDKTRVRAGPYATKAAADKVVKKLKAQGLMPVVIPPAANMAN
ncbi:MAG: SPOR domain-containing protein [Candidatus Nitrotoga sp.]